MNIDKLKRVIREANPIKKVYVETDPIRLADVLLALRRNSIGIGCVGGGTSDPYDSEYIIIDAGEKKLIWNLKKDLDNQSDELKRLLTKLLVKDNE